MSGFYYLWTSKLLVMANIKFFCKKRTNPANLNIRFYHGREIDCNAQSHILIDPNLWSKKMQNFKSLTDPKIKEEYLPLITDLKNEIITKFNLSYSKGEIINSQWLKNIISEYNKRPNGEDDYRFFFVAFIKQYAKDSETRLNPNTGKVISFRTIQKYHTVIKVLEEFEKEKNSILKITDINLNFHKQFTSFLKVKKKYSNTVIEKNISTIKGFVKEAKSYGYDTSAEVENKKFTFRRDEPIDTYLNIKEIDLIFNLDLSHSESLDNVRDIFIIGLWTGLRISDLKRINQFLFKNNTIVISETEKTGAKVEIPIHPQVKQILEKRNGALPKIISSQKFNEYIKEVCKLAGITELTLGNIKNPKTNRKEKGYYPKYQLISSHTARRSFATNHYGKLPDNTIMAITTHKSHTQFMKYIKTTQEEHLEKVAKFWEQENELKNGKPNLRVSI